MNATLFSKLEEDVKLKFKSSNVYQRSLRSYRYSPLSIQYYDQYFQHQFADTSIIVWNEDVPVLWLPAYSSEKSFSYFGDPVEVFENEDYASQLLSGYKELIKFLREFLTARKFENFLFYENPVLLSEFLSEVRSTNDLYSGEIDLCTELAMIRSSFRKSYKSLINWGEKELEIRIITQENFSDNQILEFQNFHFQVSGRKTRSDESWLTQGEMVKAGEAFLVFANYKDKLVAASMFLLGRQEVFYGVGVYDRDLMQQNVAISHFPMFAAIKESKRLAMERFVLGDVGINHSDEKVNKIAKFKKGFASRCQVLRSYKVDLMLAG